VAATLALAACGGNGEGRPDDELSGLVHRATGEPIAIDVDRAADEVSELVRALAMPHNLVAAAIGSHKYRATSTVSVSENSAVVEELTYENAIDYAADGNYRAVVDNSKDYGREIIFTAGDLFLRPRYATKFHRRQPTSADEPAQLRNDIFSEAGAYFEVVAAGAELVDRGHVDIVGRAGRKIEVKTAPETRALPPEARPQRKWRNDVAVREVSGEVILDAETGAPLAAELSAVAVFARDGRSFIMTLAVSHTITAVADTITITAPAAELTVTTIEHHREAAERTTLLDGIAPPARKAPTPKPASPTPKP
jgi:hypothetical protein